MKRCHEFIYRKHTFQDDFNLTALGALIALWLACICAAISMDLHSSEFWRHEGDYIFANVVIFAAPFLTSPVVCLMILTQGLSSLVTFGPLKKNAGGEYARVGPFEFKLRTSMESGARKVARYARIGSVLFVLYLVVLLCAWCVEKSNADVEIRTWEELRALVII